MKKTTDKATREAHEKYLMTLIEKRENENLALNRLIREFYQKAPGLIEKKVKKINK